MSQIDVASLWHQRLGHINFKDPRKLSQKEIIKGLPRLNVGERPICNGCQLGKQSKTHIRKSTKLELQDLQNSYTWI